MTSQKIKTLSDYIPLAILLVYALILVYTVSTSEIRLSPKHVAGLIVLPLNIAFFVWKHKAGVLVLGLTLLAGLFGMLAYTPAITITLFGIGGEENAITLFRVQPFFLLWLLVHFIVSGRHYVGILTHKFWKELIRLN